MRTRGEAIRGDGGEDDDHLTFGLCILPPILETETGVGELEKRGQGRSNSVKKGTKARKR